VRHEPWLTRYARHRPDRVALECGGEQLTYGELHRRAAGAAGTLVAAGVRPGDRVGIALPAGVEFAVALHACLLLRAAALPLDLRLTAQERAQRGATAAHVVEEPLGERATPLAMASWSYDDVALVVHTSGTTESPKEVALTFGNLRGNAVGSALALGLHPLERWLCPMPLTHVGGLMILLRSLMYGTTAVLAPPPFDAPALAERINRGDATMVSLVPTMLGRLLDAGLERPKRLRCALLGGGPADPALLERALAAGVPVSQTYGLTETCSQVTVSDPGEPQTAGWPLPGVLVWLAEDGEILVEGPIVAGGGILQTGDLGRFDERGRLSVIGRKADTIITGGENVAPAEVEAVLLAHPAVAEAGVFGRPDPEWGEAVCAQVVARPGAEVDPSALREWCGPRLAPFKVPKAIELVAVLPRTTSGKLLRGRLR
jgi:O-succinylbenzoic acid--CoA ligase